MTRFPRSSCPTAFLDLAARKPLGLPMLAWFAVVVAILGAAVLRWTPWGRDFYAIGSNPDAARFAGIPAGRRVILAFTICGALAGLGGFLWASRFPNVDAVAATDFELDVITAVVIGGVNVFGGSGSILGVVLGAILVATIQDGFTLLRLSEFWKMFFNGAAIIVAITIDALVTRRLQDTLRRRRARSSQSGTPKRHGGQEQRRETRCCFASSFGGRRCSWSRSSASASGAPRLSPFFLTRINLLDLMTPYVFIGLLALGLTFVVIAGEIDISVTSILAVSVVSFAQLLDHGVNVWVAAFAGLVVAAGLGLVNGALVALVGLPSLAVTLGTLAAYQGLAFVVLSGEGVAEFPQGYLNIGGGYIRNELPVAFVVLIVATVVLGLVLHATRFGRYLFAIGNNREAARLSGVPAARARVTIFVLSGLMAGIAGVAYVGFFGSARADAAQGSLLDVVTAVVLGGVSIFGGAGSMLGVFLALILVAELRNGMQLANLGGDTQNIVIGVLLLAAIVAGNLIRAAQDGAISPTRLRNRRREVVRDDPMEAAIASSVEPTTPKGR